MYRFIIYGLMAIIIGCGSAVPHTLSKDYNQRPPRTIAVLPVQGKGDADARYLFRLMVYERLSRVNYQVISLESIDERLARANIGVKELQTRTTKDLAGVLDVDALLYTTVTNWDIRSVPAYTSMKVGARFELYTPTGERLWESEFKGKESDIGLDRELLKVSIQRLYEPRVQRVVDAAFSTLPPYPGKGLGKEKGIKEKTYFDWLP